MYKICPPPSESASADTDVPSAAFALCSALALAATHASLFRQNASPAVCSQRKQVTLQRSLIETTTVKHDRAKFDSFGVLWW